LETCQVFLHQPFRSNNKECSKERVWDLRLKDQSVGVYLLNFPHLHHILPFSLFPAPLVITGRVGDRFSLLFFRTFLSTFCLSLHSFGLSQLLLWFFNLLGLHLVPRSNLLLWLYLSWLLFLFTTFYLLLRLYLSWLLFLFTTFYLLLWLYLSWLLFLFRTLFYLLLRRCLFFFYPIISRRCNNVSLGIGISFLYWPDIFKIGYPGRSGFLVCSPDFFYLWPVNT